MHLVEMFRFVQYDISESFLLIFSFVSFLWPMSPIGPFKCNNCHTHVAIHLTGRGAFGLRISRHGTGHRVCQADRADVIQQVVFVYCFIGQCPSIDPKRGAKIMISDEKSKSRVLNFREWVVFALGLVHIHKSGWQIHHDCAPRVIDGANQLIGRRNHQLRAVVVDDE